MSESPLNDRMAQNNIRSLDNPGPITYGNPEQPRKPGAVRRAALASVAVAAALFAANEAMLGDNQAVEPGVGQIDQQPGHDGGNQPDGDKSIVDYLKGD